MTTTIGRCLSCRKVIKSTQGFIITMAGEWHSGCARRAL